MQNDHKNLYLQYKVPDLSPPKKSSSILQDFKKCFPSSSNVLYVVMAMVQIFKLQQACWLAMMIKQLYPLRSSYFVQLVCAVCVDSAVLPMFSLLRCHAHFMLWQPAVPWFLALPVGQLRVESGLTQAKCRAQGTHRESPSLSIITCILIHLICAACCTLVILQQLKRGLWVLLAKMREKNTPVHIRDLNSPACMITRLSN